LRTRPYAPFFDRRLLCRLAGLEAEAQLQGLLKVRHPKGFVYPQEYDQNGRDHKPMDEVGVASIISRKNLWPRAAFILRMKQRISLCARLRIFLFRMIDLCSSSNTAPPRAAGSGKLRP
jgi:hypothetical protein